MSFSDDTPLKKVAFRYSGVYIFYEELLPFVEDGMYVLKKELADDLVVPAIYRAVDYSEPVFNFYDTAKFVLAGVMYRIYVDCDNYLKRYALAYPEYPCCWVLAAGEVVYLDTPFGNNKYRHSLVQMVDEEIACQNNLDKHNIIAHYQLIKAVYKYAWVYHYPYMNIFPVGSYIEYKGRIFYVKICGCELDTLCDEHADCFIPVEILDCCRGLIMNFTAVYSKYEYDTYKYTMVNEKRLWNLDITTLKTLEVRGCDVDLNFYSSLGIKLGDNWSKNPEHLNTDYTYKFYHNKHRLEILDKDGNLLKVRLNVITMADLQLDMDIISSCNFHIIYDKISANAFPIGSWKLKKLTTDVEHVDLGIDNFYPADRVRPYSPSDADNPTRLLARIIDLWYNKNILRDKSIGGKFTHIINNTESNDSSTGTITSDILLRMTNDFTGINNYPVNWRNILPNNYSYLGYGIYHIGVRIEEILPVTPVHAKILLPTLSIDMYPALLQILRKDETVINRPVYEPWMLWLLDFLYIKGSQDIDEPIKLPIFDLSPNYSR